MLPFIFMAKAWRCTVGGDSILPAVLAQFLGYQKHRLARFGNLLDTAAIFLKTDGNLYTHLLKLNYSPPASA